MSVEQTVQNKLAGLSALEHRLWRAFKGAESNYLPARLNLWGATRSFLSLREAGHLRLYQYYPAYALVALAFGITAVSQEIHWMFFLYAAMLIPTFLFLNSYEKAFAWHKTKMANLEHFAFGVEGLPLLVYGLKRQFQDLVPGRRDAGAAEFTKEALASVIKLVKCGHEHGEVSYGFGDLAKKTLFGALTSLGVFVFSNQQKVSVGLAKFEKALQSNAILLVLFAFMAVWIVAGIYVLFFNATNQKRQKRRYLLALNTIHELWPTGAAIPEQLSETPKQAVGAPA